MISFSDFIHIDSLDERLILLNNGTKYNQVLILSGGAGSGKGFALSNFVDSTNYKVRDVDEIKKLLQKLSALGKIDAKKIWNDNKAKIKSMVDRGKLDKSDLATLNRVLSVSGWKLHNLDLRQPDHVFALHIITDLIGWKNKSLALLKKSIPANSDHKPNIAFDMTAKDMKSIDAVVQNCLDMGYESQNIHMVWVLTKYQVAVDNNLGRERVVPKDILLDTHLGAAKTMTDLIGGRIPRGLDGSIWTILNNKENTIFWKHGDGKLKDTPEFHQNTVSQKATSKVNQAKYDRIYGDGAFVAKNKKSGGEFEKEKVVVKSFSRVHIKKAGKSVGDGVLPFKEQIYNWVIKNIPDEVKKRLIISFGVDLGKSSGH